MHGQTFNSMQEIENEITNKLSNSEDADGNAEVKLNIKSK